MFAGPFAGPFTTSHDDAKMNTTFKMSPVCISHGIIVILCFSSLQWKHKTSTKEASCSLWGGPSETICHGRGGPPKYSTWSWTRTIKKTWTAGQKSWAGKDQNCIQDLTNTIEKKKAMTLKNSMTTRLSRWWLRHDPKILLVVSIRHPHHVMKQFEGILSSQHKSLIDFNNIFWQLEYHVEFTIKILEECVACHWYKAPPAHWSSHK